jgi:abortive infection bacteriophage resistance protein
MPELKPFKTFNEQLQVLKDRGMDTGEESVALAALSRFGYYRLSGYFYPLRKTKPVGQQGRLDEFVEGASLDLVIKLADFDKKLRLLTLYAIETIEVDVRVAVAHRMGKIKPDAHMHPYLFDRRFTSSGKVDMPSGYDTWLQKFDELLDQSKEDFTKHHNDTYDGRMPIWVAIEIWDFGLLSRFFSGLQQRDKNQIASKYAIQNGDVLASWIRTFRFVRNVAAHHSRLWNRINTEIPILPSIDHCRWLAPLHADQSLRGRLFCALTLMRFLMRSILPESVWHEQVKAHVATFPKTELLSIKAAGFPDKWEDLPIWK